MNLRVALVALAIASLAAACQQKAQQQDKPPTPLDTATAEAMEMRSLQAEESGDVEAEKADLFPRQPNILSTCAKLRVDNGHLGSVAMRGEDGQIPKITGVRLGELHPQGANLYVVSYEGIGNAAFSGSETFVWANGRWWIRCND